MGKRSRTGDVAEWGGRLRAIHVKPKAIMDLWALMGKLSRSYRDLRRINFGSGQGIGELVMLSAIPLLLSRL